MYGIAGYLHEAKSFEEVFGECELGLVANIWLILKKEIEKRQRLVYNRDMLRKEKRKRKRTVRVIHGDSYEKQKGYR